MRLTCFFLALALLLPRPVLGDLPWIEVGRLSLPFGTPVNIGGIFGFYPHEPVRAGDFVYLPTGAFPEGSIVIADFNDVSSPKLVSDLAEISSRDVAISNSWLYSVDINNLHIIDVSDPVQPKIVGNLVLNSGGGAAAASIALQGTVAYVTGGGPSLGDFPALQTIDVSNPESPLVLGASAESGGADVAISGSFAYSAAPSPMWQPTIMGFASTIYPPQTQSS